MKRPRDGSPDEDDDDDWDEEAAALTIEQTKDTSGFPEAEKDTAPSAMVPAALKCVGKHNKRLGALMEKYKGSLTENQKKCLVSCECKGLGRSSFSYSCREAGLRQGFIGFPGRTRDHENPPFAVVL